MNEILHFSISPVQSFIGQSRRTRDLWSASFLLSWLTGVAMAKVVSAGGRIAIPAVQDGDGHVTDPLMRAIQAGVAGGFDPRNVPFIGTLPNRFKADVPADFDPTLCVRAVNAKWSELAGKVQEYFLPVSIARAKGRVPKDKRDNSNAQGKTLTETLWEQQVAKFWDIQWVQGPADSSASRRADDGKWLDLRKNWRHHIQPDQQEAGDACTLMPGWVELSGHVRSLYKDKQDEFWLAVREHLPNAHHGSGPDDPGPGHLSLRDDERLCAVAFIKRLWPKLPRSQIEEVIGWVPDDRTKSAGNWPSTAYMAALPWIKQVYRDGGNADQVKRCDDYVEALKRARNTEVSEAKTTEGLFSEILNQIEGIASRPYFATLDGQLFFEDGLRAAAKEGLLRPTAVADLKAKLRAIEPNGMSSPFYAVLRMDGDSVGKLIGENDQTATNATKVSRALGAFAGQVRGMVDVQHGGATLYAGGDDVLALLPLGRAFDCSQMLQAAYRKAMQDQQLAGTISAAIVFAHFGLPLSFVMAESSRLLADVAKTQNGRNSVAVAVHKPGGMHLQWAARWDDIPTGHAAVATLLDLANSKFNPGARGPNAGATLPLSSGFLYRIRERWADLAGIAGNQLGQPTVTQSHVEELWAADLLANRDLGEVNAAARAEAAHLAAQLFTISRDNQNTAGVGTPAPMRFDEAGALLVRFLATKGVRS